MLRKQLSPAQPAANRANAARSTGPRSPEGKAKTLGWRPHWQTDNQMASLWIVDGNRYAFGRAVN